MAKRSILARALGLGHEAGVGGEMRGAAPVAGSDLAAIFAALRSGTPPRDADHLPEDTGATEVLLDELDRLWRNPPQ